MGKGRWLKIYTSLMEWRWAHKPEYMSFLMWCLMLASPKDTYKENTEIKRGSFLTTVAEMSKLVGLTNRNVRTVIQNLCKCGCIAAKSTNKGTIITVCNYDSYQYAENKTDKRLTNDRQTTDKRLTNDRQTLYILESKEEKKKRKEENNIIPPLTPQGGESGNPTGEENHEGFSGELDFRESENSTENENGEGENILTLTPPTEEKKKSSAKRKKAEDFKWDEIRDWFNSQVAHSKIPQVRALNDKRKTIFRKAMRTFGRDKVAEAVRKAATVPFLNGDNDRHWVADFDFILNENKLPRILENYYDHLHEKQPTTAKLTGSAYTLHETEKLLNRMENGNNTDTGTENFTLGEPADYIAAIGNL